jgi:tetratricopeptide (TPR) repeat protein
MPGGLTFFAPAVASLDAANPEHRVALGYALTFQSFHLSRNEEAKECARRSLELLLLSGDRQGIMLAKFSLGQYLWIQGDLSQARMLLNESLALSREHPEPLYTGVILNLLALIEREFGTFPQVKGFFEEAIAEVESLNDLEYLAMLKHEYGVYLSRHGFAEEGERFVQEGLKRIRKGNAPLLESIILANLAFVTYMLGKYDEAEALALEARTLAEKLHMKYMVAFALTRLARVALARGNYLKAQHHLQESLRATWETRHLVFLLETLVLLSELAIAQGDAIVAAGLLHQPLGFEQPFAQAQRGYGFVEHAPLL